jgi:hypothetical protein
MFLPALTPDVCEAATQRSSARPAPILSLELGTRSSSAKEV